MKWLLSISFCMLTLAGCSQIVIVASDTFNFSNEVAYDSLDIKGGYKLIYTTTDAYRNLWFKGQGRDTVIWSNDIRLPENKMAELDADFEKCFVLGSGGGSGIEYVHVLDKKSLQTLVWGYGIVNDTTNGLIYYGTGDTLGVFIIIEMAHEYYQVPEDIECDQWWNCINIGGFELTDKELRISYSVRYNSEERRKSYLRKKD